MESTGVGSEDDCGVSKLMEGLQDEVEVVAEQVSRP